MAISKIGLGLGNITNTTFPTFNYTDVKDILRDIPKVANQSTNYYYGWASIIGLFIILYTSISESIGQDGFGYDETRAFAISSGITVIFGVLFVAVGFIHNFKPIGIMMGLFIVVGVIINYLENKRE